MDGLEAVELSFSEISKDNERFRVDSEYFKKEYFLIENLLQKIGCLTFDNYIELLTDGKHGGVKFTRKGVIFLKNSNLKDGIIDLSDLNFISENESMETVRAEFKENDILLTTIGSVGLSVVVPPKFPRATINQNLVRIVLSDKTQSHFIVTFLNCYYGKSQTIKMSTGNVYQMINYPNLRKVKIPNLSKQFKNKVIYLSKSSHQKLEESKSLYKQSEELLLKELDLLDFQPSTENKAIKKLSESFGDSGRLDSEYYQPKYDELITKIKSTKYDTLDNIVNIQKSIEPGSDAYQDNGIPFVRVSNLTKYGISEPNIHLSNNLFDDETLEKLQPKKDTILLSKDGTVGIAYNTKENSNLITSGALLHLTIKENYIGKVFNEYLTLVLNSLVVQMQSQRDAGGSIIKHWKPSEIKQVLIPIIDNKTQTQIEEKIKQSFKLKEQSKQLLEIAKKSVEVAIEQDETQATKLINEQI